MRFVNRLNAGVNVATAGVYWFAWESYPGPWSDCYPVLAAMYLTVAACSMSAAEPIAA